MKYTIEGFSQEYATTLKKIVNVRGKEKQIKIDCTDLVILRWFVDFFPNMKKMSVDGKEYAWLSHKKLVEDLPILDISKRSCIERMQKLVEFGILDYQLIKEGGTFSLYAFGNNYINLIKKNTYGMQSTDTGGTQSNDIGGIRSNDIGVCSQTDNKDKSIKDASISDKSIKNIKERKAASTYDELVNDYTNNDELKTALYDFIKMRKFIKSPLTDRALKNIIMKLDSLAQTDQEKIEILEQSITNTWKGVFPLKDKKPIKKYEQEASVEDVIANW